MKTDMLVELSKQTIIASKDQWDGNGTYKVNLDSLLCATALINCWPNNLEDAELSISPIGSIIFDLGDNDPNSQFSIIAYKNSVKIVEYLNGLSTVGCFEFDYLNFPHDLANKIQKWILTK